MPADVTSGHETDWRTRLPALGDYWDPVAVATTVQRARGVLYVVAPEARFGDFSPAPELPDLPWQSRPMYPPDDLNGFVARIFGGLLPGGAGRRLEAEFEQLLRAQLEETLRKSIRDPEARKRAIDEAMERIRSRASDPTRPATGPAKPYPGLVTTPAEGHEVHLGDPGLVPPGRSDPALGESCAVGLRPLAAGTRRGAHRRPLPLLPLPRVCMAGRLPAR